MSLRAWLAGPWSMKMLYLAFFMGTGAYFPYLALYLRAIHLTDAQIGVIASIVPLGGVLLQPLWGIVSDRYRRRNALLSLSILASALLSPLLALAHSFALLLPLYAVFAVTASPFSPLADATTLEWLRRRGGSYGAVRFYGSLGFLGSSLAVGWLYIGSGIMRFFFVYGAFMLLAFAISLTAPRQQGTAILAPGEGALSVLRERSVVIFLLLAVLGYGTFAAYNTFFGLYLASLGAGTNLVGVNAAVASGSELPVMALAGLVLARRGVKTLLLIGMGSMLVRWTAYGLLHDYRLAIAVSTLHGLSFAAFYIGGITYVDRHMPTHLRATGQTLFNAATFGLGTVVEANLFGLLYDRLHANGIFLLAATICALATLGFIVLIPADAAPAADAA